MDDQNAPQPDARDPGPLPTAPNPEGGASPLDSAVDNGEQHAQAAKDRLDRALVRYMAGLTLFTGALFVAAVLQFWIMRGQLGEMRATRLSGDVGTAATLRVLQTQADAMAGQLAQMKAGAIQTERIIAASNQLAREAAISAAESRRLANAAIVGNLTTKQLAAAATQANHINQQGISDSQRAFVVAKEPTFKDSHMIPGVHNTWAVMLNLQNTGNTPTVALEIHSRCIPMQGPVLDLDKVQKTPANVRYDRNVTDTFGAREEKQIFACAVTHLPAKRDEMPHLHRTALLGKIEYRDIFDPFTVHLTQYCFSIDIWGGIPWLNIDSSTLSDGVSRCLAYNCVDNECSEAERAQAAVDLAPSAPTRLPATPGGQDIKRTGPKP